MRFSGSTIDAAGKIDLTGLTVSELAASAKGTLHFDWLRGSVAALPEEVAREEKETKLPAKAAAKLKAEPVPPQLARFTRLTGEAEIASGMVTLRNTEVFRAAQHHPIEGEMRLDERPRLTFLAPQPRPAEKAKLNQPVK